MHQRKKEVGKTTEKKKKNLEELKGTKNISNVKSAKRRIPIPKIKNTKGEAIKTRKRIANVFAAFFEQLHEDDEGEENTKRNEAETCTGRGEKEPGNFEPIPEFTTREIHDAIDRLKRGKAADSSGIRADHTKKCSDETKERIRQIFNEVLLQKDCTPKTWRKIRVEVIHKKGDREDAANYRPSCSLPVLHKLFATAIYARLAATRPGWFQVQPPDGGGVQFFGAALS